MMSMEQAPDFTFDLPGFDANAAFQGAVQGVVTDAEMQLEEKISRMEHIVREGSSDIYQSFIDFRAMAAQLAALCAHDHSFSEAASASEALSGFMDAHREHEPHNATEKDHPPDDEEDDPKNRKKKKRRLWFMIAEPESGDP